jgi:trigger factor
MGVIKKQYGQAVLVDEVNKMLQSSLNDFLNEEKISILGNPLPVPVKILIGTPLPFLLILNWD